MPEIKNIGVFLGGKSPEHDISIITGQLIISVLKKMPEYKVVPVYLDKDEKFYIADDLASMAFFADDFNDKLQKLGDFNLLLEQSAGKLVFKKNSMLGKKIEIDLAFPAFHGNLGEDGSMQGFWNIFNVPFVGCDVAPSAIAMDKILTKLFYQSLNIKTTKFLYYFKADWQATSQAILQEIKEKLIWPVFVKPPHLGSSIGITKVKNFEDLANAIEVGLHYDDKILIEESVENLIDVTCAVLGNDDLTASLVQESAFSSDLFSYEDKYIEDGGAQLGQAEKKIIIPARLDEAITAEIQNTAKTIYKSLGCSGLARVDFLYNKETKELFANEINPLPGTLYHHLWQKSGIEIDQLIKTLIDLALQKHQEKNKVTYSFSSKVLGELKNAKLTFKK